MTEDELQYVKVDLDGKAYTYSWDPIIRTLEPGQLVLVPGNMLRPEPFTARVIRTVEKPENVDFEIKAVIRTVL